MLLFLQKKKILKKTLGKHSFPRPLQSLSGPAAAGGRRAHSAAWA
ncbi:hypothetical protein HMPREF0731_4157 [Pseudoroseomonas cervicalis ATCC 49957]|uniref:Uncharacterized protein n=1 Tax=Pseudoroseomonas cervicalis ATCC 49957 TaxID=525371 RepID=D5RSU5_9PROT|nr:hypothetical protein HMPREF0731_4157 [Pseudoroseomonas cervicalis ATCC 49957]